MGFWKMQIRPYTTASLIIAYGGVLKGFDTGAIGGVTVMPYFTSTLGPLSPNLRGFVVSLIMLTGAAPAIYGGQLADKFGILNVVALGAICYLVGSIMEAAAYQLAVFVVGRAITGLGMGLWLSNVNNYICEISPKKSRGTHTAMPQMMVPLGITIGWFVCYGTQHIQSSLSWRLPWIIQAGGSLIFAIICKFLPNSPRWLLLHHRREEALVCIKRLGISQQEAEEDILRVDEPRTIPEQQLQELDEVTPPGKPNRLRMIFEKKVRTRTLLAFFLLFMEGMCGIDGILYYAPILFENAGLSETTAGFIASGVSAILMTAVSIPAIVVPDKLGRRRGVVVGAAGLALCMWIIGGLYAGNAVHSTGVGRWFVIIFIFIYALHYCSTWAVCGKIYGSEIQPISTRAVVNNIATGLNFLANWIVAFVTPIFLARTISGAYFLYGATCTVSAVVLFIYMPETRGRPLEEIDEIFELPVHKGWRWWWLREKKDLSLEEAEKKVHADEEKPSPRALESAQLETSPSPTLHGNTPLPGETKDIEKI